MLCGIPFHTCFGDLYRIIFDMTYIWTFAVALRLAYGSACYMIWSQTCCVSFKMAYVIAMVYVVLSDIKAIYLAYLVTFYWGFGLAYILSFNMAFALAYAFAYYVAYILTCCLALCVKYVLAFFLAFGVTYILTFNVKFIWHVFGHKTLTFHLKGRSRSRSVVPTLPTGPLGSYGVDFQWQSGGCGECGGPVVPTATWNLQSKRRRRWRRRGKKGGGRATHKIQQPSFGRSR